MSFSTRLICPFCGSPNTDRQESAPTRRSDGYYWVECRGCRARGPRSHAQHEIDKLWDGRHEADPINRVVPGRP